MATMNTIEGILEAIETLRREKKIGNEAARLASVGLTLEGDEALLANRIIVQGSDPASLELAAFGHISESTRRAHFQGPGSLKGQEKSAWLVLASASSDEANESELPVSKKLAQFIGAVNWLRTATETEKAEAARAEEVKILELPFEEQEVAGVRMRVYTADRGFAAAYWSGQEYAAVRDPQGLLFVGSSNRPLAEIGVIVDKQLSPQFGIIFPKAS